MTVKKLAKRRGPKSTKITIDFGKSIPDILTDQTAPHSHADRLAACLKSYPDTEAALGRLVIDAAAATSARRSAAFQAFGIDESNLKGQDFNDAFDKIFDAVFPKNTAKEKPKKWTPSHPESREIYCDALRRRSVGAGDVEAWVAACEAVIGKSTNTPSLKSRWTEFKNDGLVKKIEADFLKLDEQRKRAAMKRTADTLALTK